MDADESATKTNQSKHSYRLFERAPWKLPVSDSFVFRAEILEWNFYNTGHFSPFPRMICFSFSLENGRDLEFFPSLPPLNSILQVAGIDISSIVNSPFPRSSIRSFHFPPQLSPSSLFASLSLSLSHVFSFCIRIHHTTTRSTLTTTTSLLNLQFLCEYSCGYVKFFFPEDIGLIFLSLSLSLCHFIAKMTSIYYIFSYLRLTADAFRRMPPNFHFKF